MARKLVKEMEDHKVSRPTHVSVRNRYTVFLCPEDYERLRDRKEVLTVKLERHLSKHVRVKKYDVPGDISVAVVVDHDLELGHFGILAERDAPGLVERELPARVRQNPSAGVRQTEPVLAEPEMPVRAERPRRTGAKPADRSMKKPAGGTTEIIEPADAAHLNLAWQTIVVKAGNREREFTQGRVIVGRARDADFRVDDPNVSRRHAVIFWLDGRVMIEDLGSTNGTMVNGYPVSSTVIRPNDVVVVGDCRITVETR